MPHKIGFGSTEFHVLRPGSDVVGKYLFYMVWNPIFRHVAERNMTGTAGQRRVPTDFVKRYKIPFPTPEEQRRIVAILDKADAVRQKRREAIRLTEELLRSQFLEMFGDPVKNPKGWETVPLSQLIKGDMRNGLSPSSRGTYNGEVLTLSAITQGTFKSHERKTAQFDICPPKDKVVQKSDFLVCRGNGNLGLVGCARFPNADYSNILFPDTMIGVPIDFSMVSKNYLETLWNGQSVRRQIEKSARTTNGTHKINQQALKKNQILLPPITLQKQFSKVHDAAKSCIKNYSAPVTNNLFNSLLQRAFRGDL